MYDICKARGNFAYGGLFLKERDFFITLKAANEVKLNKREKITVDNNTIKMSDFSVYLGHTQAPTSSQREFSVETSHPFKCGYWTVAHNGVLTNYNELANRIRNKKSFNIVDSSIIPALLEQYSNKKDNEIAIISETLSQLKGTFGLWIHCNYSNNIYLARSGSTLYANILTNDFSSLPGKGLEMLEEGIIYMMTNEGLTQVGKFKTNSPFFTL